jgi:hypothetical protein
MGFMARLLLSVAALSLVCSAEIGAQDVHSVHLVFSHHLDVGLDLPLKTVTNCVGFATKIVQRYFDEFIPRAISLSDKMRSGKRPFKYQIHPWIGNLYVDCVPWVVSDGCPSNPGILKCPDAKSVAEFGAAVTRGDLVFADSPMNL